MRRIALPLGENSYTIEIEAGLIDRVGERLSHIKCGPNVLLVSDENVHRYYGKRVERSIRRGRFRLSRYIMRAGEREKSPATVQRIHSAAHAADIDRGDTIVALGGGVVGDAAGFAAATWLRGIPVVQIPTTLLAQVDSSVGGKTGVNLAAGKNLVGAFHQPARVLIDPESLATLPEREYRSGFGEVIKYAMIRDESFFSLLEREEKRMAAIDPEVTGRMIARCCRFKKEYVVADEKDRKGRRAHLNFGHTFGHAVEAATSYRRYLHGEAVSLGMIAACRVAEEVGMLRQEERERLRALLQKYGLPVDGVLRKPSELVRYARSDKKVERGRLRIVLTRGIGSASLLNSVGSATLRKGFQEICTSRR